MPKSVSAGTSNRAPSTRPKTSHQRRMARLDMTPKARAAEFKREREARTRFDAEYEADPFYRATQELWDCRREAEKWPAGHKLDHHRMTNLLIATMELTEIVAHQLSDITTFRDHKRLVDAVQLLQELRSRLRG